MDFIKLRAIVDKRRSFDAELSLIEVPQETAKNFVELAHTAFVNGEIGVSLADETVATLLIQMVAVAGKYSKLPDTLITETVCEVDNED